MKDQETTQEQPVTPLTFEASFSRLEEILERMNSASISLDESLKLYEEADQLIVTCSKRLNEAEQRIEVLMKKRNGDLILGADDMPTVSKD